ncbi:MAG: hypothetical protein ACE5J3_13185, partial [Methanosarcinales archaeon]
MENTTSFNELHIRDFYKFLNHSGENSTELRIFLRNKTYPKVIHVSKEDEFVEVCKKYNGNPIYIGIHPRTPNGTKAKEVKSVSVIPMDLDAIRPLKCKCGLSYDLIETEKGIRQCRVCNCKSSDKGIIDYSKQSATKEERSLTLDRAKKIINFLHKNYGFTIPIQIDSGSGTHLYWKIPTININDSNRTWVKDRIKAFLTWIGEKFNDKYVEIDSKVHDLPRIMRVPGTWYSKGNNDQENGRVHRLTSILDYGDGKEDPKIKEFILNSPELDKYTKYIKNKEYKITHHSTKNGKFKLLEHGTKLSEKDPTLKIFFNIIENSPCGKIALNYTYESNYCIGCLLLEYAGKNRKEQCVKAWLDYFKNHTKTSETKTRYNFDYLLDNWVPVTIEYNEDGKVHAGKLKTSGICNNNCGSKCFLAVLGINELRSSFIKENADKQSNDVFKYEIKAPNADVLLAEVLVQQDEDELLVEITPNGDGKIPFLQTMPHGFWKKAKYQKRIKEAIAEKTGLSDSVTKSIVEELIFKLHKFDWNFNNNES